MTALPSTEDLARLAKAITPGPWRRNLENTVCNQIDGEHHAICTDQFCYAPEDQQDANVEAILLMPALIREVLDRREADERQRNALALALDALVDAKKDWWREAAPQWNMVDFLEWATVRKMTVAISAIRAATPATEASHD